jgi:hypothetical protein
VGDSPDLVLKAIVQALSSSRPKTRYTIGKNAIPEKIISMLPDCIHDRISAHLFGRQTH